MPSYHWRAYYGEDGYLDEREAGDCLSGLHDGEHGWKCVDQSRLTQLSWLAGNTEDIIVTVHIDEGDRAILFRRNIVEDFLGVLGEPVRSVVHVIGWQRTEEGCNVQSLTAIFPDGSIRMFDDPADIVWSTQ